VKEFCATFLYNLTRHVYIYKKIFYFLEENGVQEEAVAGQKKAMETCRPEICSFFTEPA